MPLKPGQIKDLKVKVEKLKGLEALEKKLSDLNDTRFQFDNMYLQKSNTLKFAMKEFDAVILKVKNEIEKTKQEIATLQSSAKTTKNPILDKLVKSIAKDCSQVIAVYRKTKEVLVRGTNGKPKAFMGRSWNNREPKDSDSDAQRIYDAALKSMGFSALRSNSIFTTTDVDQASNYGNVYYIFPKNGFAFHWTPGNPDLVIDSVGEVLDIDAITEIIDDVEYWYERKYNKSLSWHYRDPYEAAYEIEKFIAAVAKLKYPKAKSVSLKKLINWDFIKIDLEATNKDFAGAVKSGHEVMITGEYYAIDAESELADYILKSLKIEAGNMYF
jgi:hypothetical protein